MRARSTALVVLSALLLAGCNDSQSPPTAGPDTRPLVVGAAAPQDHGPANAANDDHRPRPRHRRHQLRRRKAGELTLRQRAAQLIMTGISTNGMTSAQRRDHPEAEARRSLLLIGPGGSLAHTRTAMAAATTAATVKGIRPLIAADQEGGRSSA